MARQCEKCGSKISFLLRQFSFNVDGYTYDNLCKKCYDDLEIKVNGKTEIVLEREQQKILEDEAKKIIFISCNTIEESKIIKYYDLITSEIVLGTGPFTELASAIEDFMGVRGSLYEEKITKAKDIAFFELKKRAYEHGANAIIAGRLDYETIGSNMIMIIASGTPVVVKSNNEKNQE